MFRTVNKVKCLNERRWYVLANAIFFVYEVPCICWRYINVDEVSLKHLLSKSYCKVRFNYYKLRQLSVLQSAMIITNPAPGQRKICKCPTPGTDKPGKCPAVARGVRSRN